MFYSGYKLFSVNGTISIRFSTHSDESIKEILLTRAALVITLIIYELFKLGKLDAAFVFRISL